MLLITTIEIDETPVEVWINFEVRFGEVEVHKITNSETGDTIDVELDNSVYNEMHEMAADFAAEHRYTKYHYEF